MNPKPQTVTFKVDATLAEAMRGMPNRSDFLRSAVLAALENTCPICKGTGLLTPRQMEHWRNFARTHSFEECEECHEYRLVCPAQPDRCSSRGLTKKPKKAKK